MASFTVQFTDNTTNGVSIECDGYAQEGTMLTFFRFGTDCDTIDSWSRRLASYRIADVASVVRTSEPITATADVPVLVAC